MAIFTPRLRGGEGTNQDDFLFGSAEGEEISGFLGDDTIFGLAGNDVFNGDEGTDRLEGGSGEDRINGGPDDDLLIGGNGFDGGLAFTTPTLAAGLFGEGGDDVLFGNAGNDSLFGDLGNDFLDGGSGDDRLDGGTGDNTFVGGSGNDTFLFNPANGSIDTIEDFHPGDKIQLRGITQGQITALRSSGEDGFDIIIDDTDTGVAALSPQDRPVGFGGELVIDFGPVTNLSGILTLEGVNHLFTSMVGGDIFLST